MLDYNACVSFSFFIFEYECKVFAGWWIRFLAIAIADLLWLVFVSSMSSSIIASPTASDVTQLLYTFSFFVDVNVLRIISMNYSALIFRCVPSYRGQYHANLILDTWRIGILWKIKLQYIKAAAVFPSLLLSNSLSSNDGDCFPAMLCFVYE